MPNVINSPFYKIHIDKDSASATTKDSASATTSSQKQNRVGETRPTGLHLDPHQQGPSEGLATSHRQDARPLVRLGTPIPGWGPDGGELEAGRGRQHLRGQHLINLRWTRLPFTNYFCRPGYATRGPEEDIQDSGKSHRRTRITRALSFMYLAWHVRLTRRSLESYQVSGMLDMLLEGEEEYEVVRISVIQRRRMIVSWTVYRQ